MMLVEMVLAMLMVAPTSVGVKSTRLCLRFRYSVTRCASPVASIPSTSVSSHCRLSPAASLLSRALLSETTSESEHHLWRKSQIKRSRTAASVESYENGGFVSRSVWRE